MQDLDQFQNLKRDVSGSCEYMSISHIKFLIKNETQYTLFKNCIVSLFSFVLLVYLVPIEESREREGPKRMRYKRNQPSDVQAHTCAQHILIKIKK
jgi:hypothetical protein